MDAAAIGRPNRGSSARPPLVCGCALWVAFAALPAARAATYHVDAAVAQSGDGTSPAQAFRTIGECAQVASAGDRCEIAAGTYRETVRPGSGTASAPLVFAGPVSGGAIISGTEPIVAGTSGVGPWEAVTINSHAIHRIQLTPEWDLGMGKNQVFVDGELMTEARWPNVSHPFDLERADYAISTDGSLGPIVQGDTRQGTYAHPDLQPGWVGGYITFGPGKEWWGRFGPVVASQAGSLTYEFQLSAGSVEHGTPAADDPFFLWGRLEALDAEREWYFDGPGEYGPANTLYLWAPGGDPSGRVVEMKRRGGGFWIDGDGHVVVEHLQLFAATVGTTSSTSSVRLQGLDSQYAGHDLLGWGGAAVSLQGAGHVLRGSLIRQACGPAVHLVGAQHRVENNVMHDLGYVISNGDGISCGDTTGSVITRNTIFETAWKGISFAGLKQGVVSYNHVYRTAKQGCDIAALNSWNGGDGEGTVVEYNVVHDVVGYYRPETQHYGGQGIRLDSGGAPNGNSNFVIHHNIVFNTTASAYAVWGLEPHMPNYGNANNQLYNNTAIGPFTLQYQPYDLSTTVVRNNLVDGRCNFCQQDPLPAGLVADHNLFFDDAVAGNVSGNPLFSGPFHHAYALRAGSPALDAGGDVPPYTDGFDGAAADIGALEAGQPPFVAGALIAEGHLSELQASCEAGTDQTLCRVAGLPIGRAVPNGFTLRAANQLSRRCSNGLDVTSHESFVVCEIDAPVAAGSYPFETSLDGSSFVASQHEATVVPSRLVCSSEAYTTPITIEDLGGRDLTRRPLLLRVDTARLIAEGTLRPDCGDLRLRNFDLTRDLAYWLEEGTCGSAHTIVWVQDPLWGPIDADHPDYSQVYLLHGNADWPSQSDRAGLFPFFSLGTGLWLKAQSLSLADGAAITEWPDVSDGADRPAVQSDAARQPVFRAGDGATFPVVEFDGVDDSMSVPAMPAQGYASVFAVYRNPAGGDGTWPRLVSAGAPGQNDYETGIAVFPELDADNRPVPLPDGGLGRAWSPDLRELGSFTLAAGFEGGGFFQGGLAEVLMFDVDVGWATGREVESYLQVKYRLLDGLPTTRVEYDQIRDICEDGVGPPGGTGGAGGDPGALPTDAEDDGCGCRLVSPRRGRSAWLVLWLALCALWLRRFGSAVTFRAR